MVDVALPRFALRPRGDGELVDAALQGRSAELVPPSQSFRGGQSFASAVTGVTDVMHSFRDVDVEVPGMCCVPCDLIFERVRSRGVMALLVLMVLFRLACDQILRTDSFSSCRDARRVQDCPASATWAFLLDPASQSFINVFFVLACAVVGLLNSMYFVRSRSFLALAAARVGCLGLVLAGLAQSVADAAQCGGPPSFVPYCREHAAPVARFLVLSYNATLSEDGAAWRIVETLWLGRQDTCDSIANATDVAADCEASVPQDLWPLCRSSEALACTCRGVEACFKGFWTSWTTTARVVVWNILLWMLLAMLLWDFFFRLWCLRGRPFARVGHALVYDAPWQLDRLARRVPLAVGLAVLLNLVWSLNTYCAVARVAVTILPLDGRVRPLVDAVMKFFLMLQFAVFLIAAVWNLFTYWEHSDQLARLPWDYLRRDSDLPEPEGWRGVSLSRLRRANSGFSAVYFGAAWASLHVGAMTSSVVFSVVIGLLLFAAEFRAVSQVLWVSLLAPLAASLSAYMLSMVGQRVRQHCCWGKEDTFPRRVGLLLVYDLIFMLVYFAASSWGALLRLSKSVAGSLVGLLSVTTPGTYEVGILSDPVHGYYLEVLWQERFKLEVDQGRIPVREPESGVGSLLQDCCCCSGAFCGMCLATTAVTSALAAWFTGESFIDVVLGSGAGSISVSGG